MTKRAFTLIELLVVIAIISILAAILFPVFAQAKLAAKGAAAISNIQQIGHAGLLYTNDFDDMGVLNGNTEPDAPFKLEATPYKSWGYIMQPYVKNYAVFQDPLTQPEKVTPDVPGEKIWGYRTQFGYAFTVHSPAVYYPQNGFYDYSTKSVGALARPADTVMFVEKKARNGNPDWYWVGSTVWGANTVNPPGCKNSYTTTVPLSLCAPSTFWGSDSTAYAGQTYEEGGKTGGVAFRRNGKSVVTWSDGHASAVGVGRLAGGTNWTPTTPSASVKVLDKERYVWDAE